MTAETAQDELDGNSADSASEDNDGSSQHAYVKDDILRDLTGQDYEESAPLANPDQYPKDNGDLYERPSPVLRSGRKRRKADDETQGKTALKEIEDDQSTVAIDATVDSGDTRGSDDDSTTKACNSLLSLNDPATELVVSTDTTSVIEDDDAQIQRETEDHHGTSAPEADVRSRRRLPQVFYVVPVSDDFSDQEPDIQPDDDDESDIYLSSASVPESVVDEDMEDVELTDEQFYSDENNEEGIERKEEEEATTALTSKPTRPKPKSRAKKKPSDAQNGKGIDFNLPPIDNIEDSFMDMTAKALELGLDDALDTLNGRQINVATMCSGTESPLLAIKQISKALQKTGKSPLHIHQKFAAEIDVFKQAFIERNQSPPLIYRDVRDFIPDDATTAITAYGAEAKIPSGLDLLVAGFVCKDLSTLNSRPKGLNEDGESGDTWRAIYSYAKRCRPSIVLLENVRGLSKLWNEVVSRWDEIGYEAAWLIRDTKRYYVPQTRERMYMIAIERSHYGKDVKKAVTHWQDLMEKLQRQCSSPYEAWLKNELNGSSDHSALISEVDWALCKLRYDHIRSEEQLGILRPVTKWSENGTVRYVTATNLLLDDFQGC
jgi:site-specific DNA-cytosine methylase